MIRLVVEQIDTTLLAKGAVECPTTTLKTFDVEAPKLEAYLRASDDYIHRRFIGIELPEAEDGQG